MSHQSGSQVSSSQRQISRRDMLRLSALTTAGALLAACAPAAPAAPGQAAAGGEAAPAQSKVKIVATTQMPITQWDPAVERALTQLPNVDLSLTMTDISQGGWAGYSDNIVTLIAGGEQLDVIMIAIEGLRLLTSKQILAPLDDFLAADTEAKNVLETDVHPTLREMLQVDGQQMEYPFSWNNMVTYYNTKIFADKGVEPPTPDWTWDQFLDSCTKIANVTGGADDLFAYSFWGSSAFGMSPWYFNNDTSALTPD